MTGQEIIDQIADELRYAGDSGRLIRWANIALTDIGSEFMFGELKNYSSKLTSVGVPDITLDADFHWLREIGIPANDRKLWPRDEKLIAKEDPKYRTNQGTIQWYYIDGVTLGLYMVPSTAVSVEYAYQRYPSKITIANLSSEYTDIPAQFHPLVAQRAITNGHRRDGRTADAQESEAAERKIVLRLGASVYRRPDDKVITGDEMSTSTRPPRPRFPGNYPDVRF